MRSRSRAASRGDGGDTDRRRRWGTEEAGWPWLRARARGRKDHLLLDQCLLREGDDGHLRWKKDIRVELQVQHCDAVVFELWTAASRSTDLLQFVATWNVDLVSSIESGTTELWYPISLRRKRHTRDLESREVEYYESSADLSSTAAYVRVSVATMENPTLGRPDPPPPDTKHSPRNQISILSSLVAILPGAASFASFASVKSYMSFARIRCATCCH